MHPQRPYVAALGAFAFVQMTGAAWAQNCPDYTPAPQPATTQADINASGISYTTANPLIARGSGADGCTGREGGTGNATGGTGQAGGGGASFSATLDGVAVQGGDDNAGHMILFTGSGGSGGGGGFGDIVNQPSAYGGDGGAAGAAGRVSVTLSGNLGPTSDPVGTALVVEARGGNGGGGGANDPNGDLTRTRYGGDGAAGAAGGQISFTMSSGTIEIEDTAAIFNADGGNGGSGGPGWTNISSPPTNGGGSGVGGVAGNATASFGTGTRISAGDGIAYVTASGGAGGSGGVATGIADFNGDIQTSTGSLGGDGSTGGNGGTAALAFAGQATFAAIPTGGFKQSIAVVANGGNGGSGGSADATLAGQGGQGADGGAGGSATLTYTGALAVTNPYNYSGGGAALLVQANGGTGGFGGASKDHPAGGYGGDGGAAGAGGTAMLTFGAANTAAEVTTDYDGFVGALVQSVGGSGGSGGDGTGIVNAGGGVGEGGGNANQVTAYFVNGMIVSRGDNSDVLIAQSVGGGGGLGGDATDYAVAVSQAIGGNGGTGGDGGNVNVALGEPATFASTSTKGGGGILAQSVGGGGGAGGSSNSEGAALFSLAIGGRSRTGGVGGAVDVESSGLLTTYGDHATGIDAQSIGGGGGNGGSALVFVVGAGAAVGVAIGGQGGSGGAGGTVTASSSATGQVTTYGPDSFGIRAQSVGGGGGNGGAAATTAVALSPHADVPSISVAVALGGGAGSGNTANTASADNQGIVTTAGHGSIGMMAQSVGGGGGTGGDSSATSYSLGKSDIDIAVNVALGGSAGTGGKGAGATATSEGLIYTLGQDADGVVAQSVGGGGGNGGGSDSAANGGDAETGSFAVSISVGGTGGQGGVGGAATANNTGGLATLGDGANGLVAQSVGGGGGNGGGGTAASGGGNVSAAVDVGGNGGAGNDGGAATATNSGAILAYGGEAMGIFAQSVGGGGGQGGKATSTAGGSTDGITLANQSLDAIENGLGAGGQATKVTDGVFEVATGAKQINDTVSELEKNLAGKVPEGEETSGVAASIDVAVAVGGSGGAAGNGGTVTATNSGGLLTAGAQGDGVWAQSVGGGGGLGGAASANGAVGGNNQFAIGVGGAGGAAGNGGAVTATNAQGATLQTLGASAFGLAAQSVGGGGGRAGTSGATTSMTGVLSVAIGARGGATGTTGTVTAQNQGAITTAGRNGIGIFAQSVGAGGGLSRVTTLDQNGAQTADQSAADETVDYKLVFASDNGGTKDGAGGAVAVSSTGTIATSGRSAHGVLAQSVGGGGGAVVGGLPTELDFAPDGHTNGGSSSGDGGAISLDLGGSIQTSGEGAYGVWAQSVGGGGGLTTGATPVENDEVPQPTTFWGSGGSRSGNGGVVNINLSGAKIRTSAQGATAVQAQSFGGGGLDFYYANKNQYFTGTFGGAGAGGDISIDLKNTQIQAPLAAGIIANSDGQTDGSIAITLDQQSSVFTETGTALWLQNGSSATITNAGSIRSLLRAAIGYSSAMQFKVDNTGTIGGNIVPEAPVGATPAPSAAAVIVNRPHGVLAPYDTIDLGETGRLRNAGVVEVSGVRRFGKTELTGDLVQTDTGRLRFDLNSVAGKVDHLHVTGSATLAGGFELVPTRLLPGSHEVLTADGGVTLDAGVSPVATHVFTFTPSVAANRVSVATTADFSTAGAETGDRQSVAGHLQQVWDAGGSGFATGFGALATVADGDADGYAAALDNLSGQAVAAIGYARYLGSQGFAQATYSCPRFEDASVVRSQSSCSWFRVRGSWLNRDASGDDPGFSFDAVTTAIGGQKQIGEGLFLGGAIGWESSRLNSDADATSVDGDSYLAAVSLKREVGPWTLTGALDLGWGDYDSSRQIVVGTANETAGASPNTFNSGLHVRTAYEVPRGTWYMEPALDVDLAYVRLDSYTENGAGDFDLAVDQSDSVVLAGTPWLKLGRRVDLASGGVLDAYVSGGVSFSTGEDFDTTSRFAGAPEGTGDFTTTLDNPNVIGRVSAGVELYATDRVSLRLQYDGSFADGQTDNGGQFRVSYFF